LVRDAWIHPSSTGLTFVIGKPNWYIYRPIYTHNTSSFLRCSAHLDFSPIRLRNNNNWWWKLFWF
jgi:hypothetical protein